MLHERRLTVGVSQDLGRVYASKLQLLDWLLRTPPLALDDNAPLLQHFGVQFGEWLWVRIRRPATRTSFGNAVMALAAKAQETPAPAALVADAITSDSAFDARWDVAGNELQFPRLHPGWLDAIKDVSIPFYDWLAGDGFEAAPFGLANGTLCRMTVMRTFRAQSHGVCGYCDGPLGEVGTQFEANDCDHFFPKARWPHLAIHPANLFSACKGCNSTWKGAGAPMGEADAAGILGSYHPMLRPGATAVLVHAAASPANARHISISITDPVVPRRAETLVETLDLASRWTNSVNEKLDQGVSILVAKAARDRGRGWQADEASVLQVIEDEIAWASAQIGREERSIRHVAALQYLKHDLLHEVVAALAP